MDKKMILELLARKMAGEATPDEMEQLEELLASYPETIYYEEFLNELWQQPLVAEDAEAQLDRLYLAHQLKFYQDFMPAAVTCKSKNYDSFKNLIGTSVGVVVFLLICFSYWSINDKGNSEIQIISGKGSRKKIRLPDGTIVWLNAESKLSYAANFNQQDTRKVYLVGEAFFDVSHQPKHPFIVRTNKISVKVLGTAFNIQAYPEELKSETTLLRGSIELSVNDGSGQKVILGPSEKLACAVEKKKLHQVLTINHVVAVKIGKDEYIEETSWKDNRLVFQNESFEELKPKLERWFNVQLNITSQQPKKYRFTGIFTTENIHEALTAMQLIKPFTFKINAHDITIY